MKRQSLYFYLLALGFGAAAAVSAGMGRFNPFLAGLFIICLITGIVSNRPRRYKPRHSGSNVVRDIEQNTSTPGQTEGAVIEAPPPPSAGLPVKQSLIEAIGQDALAAQNLDDIGARAIDYLHAHTSADIYLILVRVSNRLVVSAHYGAPGLLGAAYAVDGSLAATIGDDGGELLNIPNIAVDTAMGFRDDLTNKLIELGAGSVLMSPVGRVGLLALSARRPTAFTRYDEANVKSFSVQLGFVLESVRQNNDLKQSINELDSLFESVHQVRIGQDLDEILRSALDSAVQLSGARSGSFLLYDEPAKRLKLRASVGLPEAATVVDIGVGEGIAGWVAAHRKPVVIKDANGAISGLAELDEEQVVKAMALPVLLGDRLIGVLNLGSLRREHEFSAYDVQHVVKLLGQAGSAIVAGQAREEWQNLYLETIRALAEVLESRDPFSQGHSAEVARLAVTIAVAMKLATEEVQALEVAALLHDIGVAGISDSVFKQERPLSSVERLLIRSHPKLGAKALSEIQRLKGVLPIILHHHENFDGTGYVDGLKGEEIPLGARILAVAEAYASMVSTRPYRPAKTPAQAMDELRSGSGTLYDPQIVYAFCRTMETTNCET